MSIDLAVIGGTGLYRFPGLEDVERDAVDTPYGKPSGEIIVGGIAGKRVAFMARHGEGHSIAPHRINYRANVWALASTPSAASATTWARACSPCRIRSSTTRTAA
jgi:5'-methylthioinosine phosphorylase